MTLTWSDSMNLGKTLLSPFELDSKLVLPISFYMLLDEHQFH